jgi:nitroreductase
MRDDYFSTRSSVRQYSDREVPRELLIDIIEKAMRAPTCGNMQLYSIVVTTAGERKARLNELHFNQPAAATSPVILTICADFNRFTRWCEISGADPGYDNFHSFITATTDAVIMAQQIVTVAEMNGLGTCYLGTVNYNAAEISKLLELPDLVVPVASLAIGYPAKRDELCERLPVEAVVHFDTYRKDSDREITDLFKVKDDFEANRNFVKENGKRNLAELFTDIRYPRKLNEEVSESFSALIREKGFLGKEEKKD